MDHFPYRGGQLYCEEIPVAALAERFGTPLYVYSRAAILGGLRDLKEAFATVDPLVCYAVKANSNLGILALLAEQGCGFDVVSGGELERVRIAGGAPGRTVFAGVGKTDAEIRAGLEAGILMFNVESEAELDAIARVAAAMGRIAPIALRVNPDVDPGTHHYVSTGKKESKFGMEVEQALALAGGLARVPNVALIGLHMHIGSQITSPEPYAAAVGTGAKAIATLRGMGHPIAWLNLGGGFGIDYRGHEERPIAEFARAIVPSVPATGCRLALEPGRALVGNAGILVSRVLYTKQAGSKRFLIQDAAMNDLLRPALYEAYHRIGPVVGPSAPVPVPAEAARWDVVGPVCESADFLARDRALPPLGRGDLLAVFSAGAYGMAMASNYNSRPRAAEVLVDGTHARLVRRRETIDDLVRAERGLTEPEFAFEAAAPPIGGPA